MTDFDEEALGAAYERGLKAEKSDDVEAAAEAYRECLRLDPADHVGATIRLAGLGLVEPPASVGHAYVSTLFDQHAETFDDILVRQLHYRVPEMVGAVLRRDGRRYANVLDLGCGTGLTGAEIEDLVDHLTGVDLSEEMVRVSDERAVYDRLFVAEAVDFLRRHEPGTVFDLIVATDVVPYLGALEPFLSGLYDRLEGGGRAIFSTETMSDEALAGRPYAVGRDQRFHHGESYLRNALLAQGFDVDHFEEIVVRLQEGKPAPGHLVMVSKPV
ncbi:class I SAM-dependent DNA methyltransferase [Fulvimarina endophytica]|uniref:class I SAM-dependent DNA methyltransferase n=1 Tax=Fulvimarina endophytica TaxID=2293836 RepID=UPI001FE13205|nr:methyltransferase [Fulvimarina endophytica]